MRRIRVLLKSSQIRVTSFFKKSCFCRKIIHQGNMFHWNPPSQLDKAMRRDVEGACIGAIHLTEIHLAPTKKTSG